MPIQIRVRRPQRRGRSAEILDALRQIDPHQGVDSVLAFVEHATSSPNTSTARTSSTATKETGSPNRSRFVRSYKDELPTLRDLLPDIQTPAQIITGDHDPGVLPVNGEYLHERLPHNRHDHLDAGHFAWADAMATTYGLLIDWWTGGYERV